LAVVFSCLVLEALKIFVTKFEHERRWVCLANAKANPKCCPLFVVNPREQDTSVERKAVHRFGAVDRENGDEVVRDR
jgi:hypothetical protein